MEATTLSLEEELAQLRAENASLKSGKPSADKPLTMKIGAKGGLSVYNLGRFPVTLYKEQWIKLLAFADQIREFITDNEDQLKVKE